MLAFTRRFSTAPDLASLLTKVRTSALESSVIPVLRAAHRIHMENSPTNDFNRHVKDYTDVTQALFKHDFPFSQQLLKEVFLLKLPSKVNLEIIKHYYEKNPDAFIDKSVALVALRKALFDADYKNAIKITDQTVAHPRYIDNRDKIMRRGIFKLIATSVGITAMNKFGINALIEWFDVSELWRHLSSINSMLLTYLINSSFFVTIVRFGRQMVLAGGDYLTWQQGTFYTHWFRHVDELLFCSKIVELDRMLNGGELSKDVIGELTRTKDENIFTLEHTLQPGTDSSGGKVRLLKAKDNLDDLKLQAYWMSGGDGFEWVEPDQDPAEIIWKEHLGLFEKDKVGESKAQKLEGGLEGLIE